MADKSEPRTFTDAAGDKWTLAITYADALKLRASVNLDLRGSLLDGFSSIADLVDDDDRLFKALEILLARQMQEAGIDKSQLAERMSGDAMQAAGISLARAAVDFFREPRRTLGHAALDKGLNSVPKMQSDVVDAMNALQGVSAQAQSTDLSGEPLESSESIQAHSA